MGKRCFIYCLLLFLFFINDDRHFRRRCYRRLSGLTVRSVSGPEPTASEASAVAPGFSRPGPDWNEVPIGCAAEPIVPALNAAEPVVKPVAAYFLPVGSSFLANLSGRCYCALASWWSVRHRCGPGAWPGGFSRFGRYSRGSGHEVLPGSMWNGL